MVPKSFFVVFKETISVPILNNLNSTLFHVKPGSYRNVPNRLGLIKKVLFNIKETTQEFDFTIQEEI